MMHLHPFWIRLLAVIGMLLPLPACALSGNIVEGQVQEEGTNKPIPEAIVIVRWQGRVSAIVDAQTVCVHVDSAVTDTQGHYRFPKWRKESQIGPVSNLKPVIIAHHPGYRWSERLDQTGRVEYLAPFTGTRGERLGYLKRVSSATGCSDKKEIESNLLPLYRALYEEAKDIAVTKEDREKVETLLFALESIEFGSMEALNRMTERRKMQK